MGTKRKMEVDESESKEGDEPMQIDHEPSSSFKVIGQETFVPVKKIEYVLRVVVPFEVFQTDFIMGFFSCSFSWFNPR